MLGKSMQNSREKNLKKIQEYQTYRKRQQKLNIIDLGCFKNQAYHHSLPFAHTNLNKLTSFSGRIS
jgi:hypothetical protein